MSVILVLIGVVLMVLPGHVAPRARVLSASEWGWLNRVILTVGFTAVQLGLVLVAAPTILRSVGLEAVADACHWLLGPMVFGGAPVGWASGVASVALFTAGNVVRRRALRLQRAAHVEEWLGDHRDLGEVDLVTLPTDDVAAYATIGSPPQVVLSSGLTRALSPEELDAVIAHELAHLRNRHHRDLVLAAMIDATLGWIPGVRVSTATLRLSLERWADEAAAKRLGARDSIWRALLKTTEAMLGPTPAFTAASTLAARLEALAAPPSIPALGERLRLIMPLAGLAVVATASPLVWSVYTHHSVLGIVGFCPF